MTFPMACFYDKTHTDLLSIKGDAEKMKQHYRHMLTFNAFENAPLADVIDLCLPSEVLHDFGNGISKYVIEVCNEIIGRKTENIVEENKFDGVHHVIAELADRQSEELQH